VAGKEDLLPGRVGMMLLRLDLIKIASGPKKDDSRMVRV
jgi:hypothetical protein